jgi:hypothetical protein
MSWDVDILFVPTPVAVRVALALAQYVIVQFLLECGKQVSNTKQQLDVPGVTILVVVVLLVLYLAPMLGLLALERQQLRIAKVSSSVVDLQPTNGLLHRHVQRCLLTGMVLLVQSQSQTLVWVHVDGLYLKYHNYQTQDTFVGPIGILTPLGTGVIQSTMLVELVA